MLFKVGRQMWISNNFVKIIGSCQMGHELEDWFIAQNALLLVLHNESLPPESFECDSLRAF